VLKLVYLLIKRSCMHTFRIVPISTDIVDAVRKTLKSPGYGHPAHVEVATGYGPCRSCLNTFVEGQEKRILFTYDPFRNLDPYPSPGPVFIHEQPCPSFADEAEFPAELRRIPLVLEAFGENRTLISEDRFRDGNLEPRAQKVLEDARVKYIHLRNGEAGCFIARIERVNNTASRAS
jgi:Protein of unknown function (DUF1203)